MILFKGSVSWVIGNHLSESFMSMVKIGIPLHVFPGEMDPLMKLFNRIDQTDLPQEDKDELMLLIDEFKDQLIVWRA
jgi:hypothetical protein